MIAPMEKLFIAGPNSLAENILLELQRIGVVQIDPLSATELGEHHLSHEEEVRLKKWQTVATAADHTLRLLGLEPDPAVKPFQGDVDQAESLVLPYEKHSTELVERRERLREELELIGQYREVVEQLADAAQGLDESPRLSVLPFLIDSKEDLATLKHHMTSALDGRFIVIEKSLGKRFASLIVVLRQDADEARGVLSHLGLGEIPRPRDYAHMNLMAFAVRLTERSEIVPREMSDLETDFRHLIQEGDWTLKELWNRARNEILRLQTLKAMSSGRYGFVLFGWLPSTLKDQVLAILHGYEEQTVHIFEPVNQHSEAAQIPVTLANPGWVRPFESLISFLNTPRYDSWDPTWIIAVLFPLWFGMIVGDIGYGLVFAGAAYYLSTYVKHRRTLKIDFFKLRLSPEAVRLMLGVLKPMIAWTIVWGFVYGEFFGDLLQRLGIFGTSPSSGLIPVLIPRTETPSTASMLILVSIAFGVLQVLHGFYLKAMYAHRTDEKKHFWEASGYFGGVAALVLFAYAFMAHDFRLWLVAPTLGFSAVFLLGVIRAKMPLMIAELPTQGGHILSYIRIYAVGLASAILANLSTNVGFALFHLFGVAGMIAGLIAGIVMALLIHAVLLVLLTVSHVLQPIRLIWVEFFTKFDFYTSSGRPYRPFKSVGGSL